MKPDQPIDELLLQLSSHLTDQQIAYLRNDLIFYVNDLLVNDFPALVQLLYRIDVSEKKLKQLLHDNPNQDAATLIADLIIERQFQKQDNKASFFAPPDVPDEERWWELIHSK